MLNTITSVLLPWSVRSPMISVCLSSQVEKQEVRACLKRSAFFMATIEDSSTVNPRGVGTLEIAVLVHS
jgi:hypothetical protein